MSQPRMERCFVKLLRTFLGEWGQISAQKRPSGSRARLPSMLNMGGCWHLSLCRRPWGSSTEDPGLGALPGSWWQQQLGDHFPVMERQTTFSQPSSPKSYSSLVPVRAQVKKLIVSWCFLHFLWLHWLPLSALPSCLNSCPNKYPDCDESRP